MSEEDNKDDDRNKTAAAIIDMLKEAGVSTQSLEDKEHKFWDTQVSEMLLSSISLDQ